MATEKVVSCDRCGDTWVDDHPDRRYPNWTRIIVDLPGEKSDDCGGFDICRACGKLFADWIKEGQQ